MWATYKGRSATVTMLLARGVDVNAHGNFHISSLLWAAGRGYPDIVKDLIAHGAKVNVGDKVIVDSVSQIDGRRVYFRDMTCPHYFFSMAPRRSCGLRAREM